MVLDVMLPDRDGFSILQEIRQDYFFPVLMLTAKGEAIDTITGVSLGADDYITKPFIQSTRSRCPHQNTITPLPTIQFVKTRSK